MVKLFKNWSRSNKHGAITIFLSIILSSIILIESIYVLQIISINKRLEINRALKNQVEIILSDYNRLLFDIYGIYAININSIDMTVFNKTLEVNGYSYGEDIVIDGYDVMSTADLKNAIATYYSYRAPGIAFNLFDEYINTLLEQVDTLGIGESISSFLSSGASEVFYEIMNGSSDVIDFIDDLSLLESLGISKDACDAFSDFADTLNELSQSELSFDDDFDPMDFFGMNTVSDMEEFFDDTSEFNEGIGFGAYCSHYSAYNFDTILEDNDMTINGTNFSSIHHVNTPDAEYILTGFEGGLAVATTGYLIYQIIGLSEIVEIVTDPSLMETFLLISEAISGILLFLSIPVPPQAIQIIVAIVYGLINTINKMVDLYDGETVNIFRIPGLPDSLAGGLQVDYKYLLFTMSCYIPYTFKLERMLNVLNRDFVVLPTEITLSTNYIGDEYEVHDGYQMYY